MLRHLLPNALQKVLWGDRKKYGKDPADDDPEWRLWHDQHYLEFYSETQRQGIGERVCNAGYPVLRKLGFSQKSILEIGPGIIRHLEFIDEVPASYTIVDTKTAFLDGAERQLRDRGFSCESVIVERGAGLPFESGKFDCIISFYSLEHLHPLDKYLGEFERVMKSGAVLAGAIPCDGGLAWGLGRYLTTRRHVMRRYGIDYDKIMCWDHPNLVDAIFEGLESRFARVYWALYPFPRMPIDVNLVGRFIYRKK